MHHSLCYLIRQSTFTAVKASTLVHASLPYQKEDGWAGACLLCLARLRGSNRVSCRVRTLGRLACPDGALLQQVGRVLPPHRHHAGRQWCMHPFTGSIQN